MTDLEREVARVLAPHIGNTIIDAMPADRAELRARFRSGEIDDINTVTREDCIEAARAAIAVVVERCAEVADNHVATGYMSGRERDYCHRHGDEIASRIRALAASEEVGRG